MPKSKSIRPHKLAMLLGFAAGVNEAGRQKNLEEKAAKQAEVMTEEETERRRLIDGMTNWQRTQYMRAKPAGKEMPLDQVRMFATAQKRA